MSRFHAPALLLAGAFLGISYTAASDSSLPATLLEAIERFADADRRVEEERIAAKPDVIDCDNLGWMLNCEELNTAAKQSPEAPIRITDQTGFEWNLQPGTPRPVITFHADPSEENARAMVAYFRGMTQRYAAMSQTYAAAHAQMTEDEEPYSRFLNASVDYSAFEISAFFPAECRQCRNQARVLRDLKDLVPGIRVRVYVDVGQNALASDLSDTFGLRTSVLSVESRGKIERLANFDRQPVLWVDNNDGKTRVPLEGLHPADNLLHAMRESYFRSSGNQQGGRG